MRKCEQVAARHDLKVVFLTVGFQVIWISHSDAVTRCVIKSRLYTNCISKLYIKGNLASECIVTLRAIFWMKI